jgi:cysteinyl-tRNA synthetase
MVKFGGVRTAPRTLKYLKSRKTRKILGRTGIKKTLKGTPVLGLNTKNLERMLGANKTQHRITNIKKSYEETKNFEEQMLETANKFIKLFNNILHNEQKYLDARVKIETMLEVLNASKGNPIERHNIENKNFKSKLQKKLSDDLIRTYRNLLKVAKDVYETSNNEEQREASSLFLSTLIEELYKEFFPSKKNNMNMNFENENDDLDDLLNMFKKSGI